MDEPNPALRPDEIDAGPADALAEGGRRHLALGSIELTLFRLGNRVVAIRNQCPHANARLGDGMIKGFEIECPIHHWKFDLHSGATKRDRRLRAEVYATRIVDGRIVVQVPGLVVPSQKEGSCGSRNPSC